MTTRLKEMIQIVLLVLNKQTIKLCILLPCGAIFIEESGEPVEGTRQELR
jgi:hypothetical protein